MAPIKSILRFEALTLNGFKKNGLDPANGPSKNIWGVLVEKIEYSTNMSEKSFFLYYEMEQTYNFIVKTKSFITQRFLNQSR